MWPVSEQEISQTTPSTRQPYSISVADRPPIEFWFREIDSKGVEVGLDRFRGFHDGNRLVLGIVEIPDTAIQDTICQGEHLKLTWLDPESGDQQRATIRVYKNVGQVKAAIDFGLSRRRFDKTLEFAAEKHVGHHCRQSECPHCQAKILTMETGEYAPQVYCEYCDSLFTTIQLEGISTDDLNRFEKNYRICDTCKMYSRPRQFSVAYFYFLIFHAGVHHKIKQCCPACMRRDAWLMLFGNLPFLLGIPFAITQLIRVYGDSIRKGPFRGLDEANALLRRGQVERALDKYAVIIERHPVNAGVLYNIALGLIAQKREASARETLEMALENCTNYPPVAAQLKALQTELVEPSNLQHR